MDGPTWSRLLTHTHPHSLHTHTNTDVGVVHGGVRRNVFVYRGRLCVSDEESIRLFFGLFFLFCFVVFFKRVRVDREQSVRKSSAGDGKQFNRAGLLRSGRDGKSTTLSSLAKKQNSDDDDDGDGSWEKATSRCAKKKIKKNERKKKSRKWEDSKTKKERRNRAPR